MLNNKWNGFFISDTILSLFSLSVCICCSPLFIPSLFLSFSASSLMKCSTTNKMDYSSVTQSYLSLSLFSLLAPLFLSWSVSNFPPFFLSSLFLHYIIDEMLNNKWNGFFISDTILSLFSLSVGICCSPLLIPSLFLSFSASSLMKCSLTNEMDY